MNFITPIFLILTFITSHVIEAYTPTFSIVTLDSAYVSSVPDDLKFVHLIDPNELDTDNAHYPVLRIGIVDYWALSYIDNRGDMALLAYNNKNNTLVSRIELSGARYLFNVTVNPSTNKAHFIGQSNEMAQINLRQIYVPIVQTLNASLQPDPPSGLKYIHLIDPNSLDVDDEHYPVLTIEDINYWALSYVDNRVGMAIVGYNQSNFLITEIITSGARYLYNISMTSTTATFLGQDLLGVVLGLARITP